MRESRVGVGVIGVGGISSYVHLPGLRLSPRAEIVALCDTNEELLRERGREYGVSRLVSDYQELLRLPSVDAVVIATPTVLHAPIALAAVAAGKHVLVEKQLAMDYAEALAMYEAAERAGVVHMTAFTYRFVPAMRHLKRLLGEGAIGLPRHVRVARLQDWPEEDIGWRQQKRLAGSGEVGDMGAHRIDFCHDLIGPISGVVALTRTFAPERAGRDGRPVPTDVEDFAAMIAEFAPGVGVAAGTVAAFDLSKVTKGRGLGGRGLDDFEVYGTEGTLVYHLNRPTEIELGRPDGPLEAVPVPRDSLVYPGSPRDPDEGDPTTAFRYDQDVAFVEAIAAGRPALVPSFYDGARCQAVIDAALQSAAERRWVDVVGVPPVTGPLAASATKDRL